MDKQSIEGFALAGRAMEDALRGHIDDEKLTHMFDRYCRNPYKGLAEYHHLVHANGLLTRDLKAKIGEALDLVSVTEPGSNELNTEEQGIMILTWLHGDDGSPKMSVAEAAEYIGISVTAVMKAINRKAIKARQPKGPGTDWVLDAASVEEYKARRDRREARR